MKKTNRKITHQVTADLTAQNFVARKMLFRADTINEANRSVEATLSTPMRVQVFDFGHYRMIEEVLIPRGMETVKQVPLLNNHSRKGVEDILGSVRNITNRDGVVRGTLMLAEDDEQADKAWSKIRGGHLTDVSIGYHAIDFVDIKPNTSKLVDGKRYTAGELTLRVTTRWRLKEVSVVPIGADQAAKMRAELSVSQRSYFDALSARATSTPALPDTDAIANQARDEERQRIIGIHTRAEIAGERSDCEMVVKAIAEGTSERAFADQLLQLCRNYR